MMLKLRHRLFAHRGVLLLGLMILALSTSPAAHEIHDADHHAEHVSDSIDEITVQELLLQFRVTGDDRYLDQAWSIVEETEGSGARHPDFLIDAAMVAQARHQFDTALAMAHGSVELRPDADQAWLLIASIQLVRGEPDLAQDACGRLTRSSWLVAVGCHARVSHARGDSEAVQSRVERLIGIIDRSDFMEADLAWFLAIAGDLAAANERTSLAIERFQQSLALSESAQVRAALVDVLIGAERYIAARDALAGGSAALPLEIRRMIVATRLGRQSDMASEIAATDRTFQEWMAAEDWLHAREMARFYLDVLPRPELARHIALINIEIQREIEDLRLLLRTGQATSL